MSNKNIDLKKIMDCINHLSQEYWATKETMMLNPEETLFLAESIMHYFRGIIQASKLTQ